MFSSVLTDSWVVVDLFLQSLSPTESVSVRVAVRWRVIRTGSNIPLILEYVG